MVSLALWISTANSTLVTLNALHIYPLIGAFQIGQAPWMLSLSVASIGIALPRPMPCSYTRVMIVSRSLSSDFFRIQ